MKNGFIKITSVLVLLAMLLAGCGTNNNTDKETKANETTAEAETTDAVTTAEAVKYEEISLKVRKINKYGNVILETTFEEMAAKSIEITDIITVKIGESSYEVPVVSSFSDVNSGEMACRFDDEDKEVGLAINGGNFAATVGMATKETVEEDPGYRWDIKIDTVTLVIKEKAGYADQYKIRKLERTYNREDYSALSDEEYANFRAVSVTGIKENILYRSSSPIDDDIGRASYAMTATEKAGIKTILNLDDGAEEMKEYDGYEGSYYASCAIANITTDYGFTSETFAASVKAAVETIISNDGPYLIHCKEGKDRTGMLCAVLEAFAGASYEEIDRDYILTYINYYGVESGSETHTLISKTNLQKTLSVMFGIEDITTSDLKAEATEYLKSAGLTEEQLTSLSAKICK